MSADNLFATAVAITREHAAQYLQPVGPTAEQCVAAVLALPDDARDEVLRRLAESAKLPHYTGGGMAICRDHHVCYTGPTCPACDWQKRAESAERENRTLTESVERYEDAAQEATAGAMERSNREASAYHAMTGE